MSVIRPEVTAAIWRAREVIAALGVVAVGLWLMWLGGYLLVPVGGVVVALGAGWGLLAFRRMRFAQGVDAPGVVEVDEGQVGYFGPGEGGFVGLPDLVELRLIMVRGGRFWRLKQADGQALLIPVNAAGAERLFDAFASLPGMDTQALVTALAPMPADRPSRGAVVAISDSVVIWRRAARVALT
jgi:hypothetical protein